MHSLLLFLKQIRHLSGLCQAFETKSIGSGEIIDFLELASAITRQSQPSIKNNKKCIECIVYVS